MPHFLSQQFTHLKTDFWHTLYNWQNQRWLWLTGAIVAVCLDLIAIFFFQNYLRLDPCEKCVYIRLSVLVIAFAMFLAFLNPKSSILKTIAYLLIAWAIIQGILWSLELNAITKAVENMEVSSCKFTTPEFPFGLPLDAWFPSIFMATGICGEDTWRLFGFNMAQYMLVVYAVYLILLLSFGTSIVVNKLRAPRQSL